MSAGDGQVGFTVSSSADSASVCHGEELNQKITLNLFNLFMNLCSHLA